MPDLVLGPLLRYVGADEATVWVMRSCASRVIPEVWIVIASRPSGSERHGWSAGAGWGYQVTRPPPAPTLGQDHPGEQRGVPASRRRR